MLSLIRVWCFAGFTKRDESEYDPFGAGHSSTSISAALGMAVARDFKVQHCRPNLASCPAFLCDSIRRALNCKPFRLVLSHVQGRKNHCVAVIGDGAITGGMAYEAMNHAGFLDKNMIVILNDNQQVHDRLSPSQQQSRSCMCLLLRQSTPPKLHSVRQDFLERQMYERATAHRHQLPLQYQGKTRSIGRITRRAD